MIEMKIIIILSYLALIIGTKEIKASETCLKLSNVTALGKTLISKLTLTIEPIGYQQCAKECYARSDCLSFNYDWKRYSCDLNYKNESTNALVNNYTTSYTKRVNIPKELIKQCSNVTCPDHSKCVQLSNGGWTCISVKLDVATCADIKSCNSNYGDGEYWIRPLGNNYRKTKVYCHGMANNPNEYITLYNPNESIINLSRLASSNPCQWNAGLVTRSYFRKIRINLQNMAVIRNDKTFADLTTDPSEKWGTPDFGYGLGCAINPYQCTKIGYFLMDTTNTGLIIDPSINYIVSGYIPYMGQVTRSANNYRIEVRCDGACGYCFPNRDLILINSNDEVPEDSASYVYC